MDSQRINIDVDVDNMSKLENTMPESGWTTYLDGSSWSCKDDTAHLVMERRGCKEASEITESVEHIDSSMASDASSGPILHQLDQSPHPVSCPTRVRRLQQDVEYDASFSTTDEPRKNSKIRRVENNEAALLQDTATSSLRSSKSRLVEGEAIVKKRALEQKPIERLHEIKICMEEEDRK